MWASLRSCCSTCRHRNRCLSEVTLMLTPRPNPSVSVVPRPVLGGHAICIMPTAEPRELDGLLPPLHPFAEVRSPSHETHHRADVGKGEPSPVAGRTQDDLAFAASLAVGHEGLWDRVEVVHGGCGET